MHNIKHLIFLAVLLTTSLISFYFYFLTKVDFVKEEKRKEYYKKQRKFLSSLSNNQFSKRIDYLLKEGGYPGGITVELYLFFLTMVLLISIYIAFSQDLKDAFVFIIIPLVPLHLYLYKSYKDRVNKLKISLCDIQDIVYFQSKIGTPMDIILANIARIAKEPLNVPFKEVASTYKLTRNMDKALDVLTSTSNIMEIQAFAFILKQKNETGFSNENHKAQAVMLKRNKRLKQRLERADKRNKLLFAAILLFICYTLMLVAPIFKELFANVTRIMN